MGSFDNVAVHCPVCGTGNELQSKAGDCNMSAYTVFDMPPAIAADLDNQQIQCGKCKSLFKLKVQFTVTHHVLHKPICPNGNCED